MRVRIYLVLPDLHYPFEMKSYILIIAMVIRMLAKELDGIIQLGDFIDNWQLSTYDKDPARKEEIEEDLALYSAQLDRWEHALKPGAEFHQIEGNHEDRLRRYIWKNSARLNGIVKSFPEILCFKDRNREGRVKFTWHPYSKWNSCQIGNTVFTHGFYFDKHTAVNNLTRYTGINIVHGHTHRFQYASNGEFWSVTLGMGAEKVKVAHTPTPQAAQEAFGIYTVIDGKGYFEPFLVVGDKCLFRGELLHAKA